MPVKECKCQISSRFNLFILKTSVSFLFLTKYPVATEYCKRIMSVFSLFYKALPITRKFMTANVSEEINSMYL